MATSGKHCGLQILQPTVPPDTRQVTPRNMWSYEMEKCSGISVPDMYIPGFSGTHHKLVVATSETAGPYIFDWDLGREGVF